VIVFQVHHYGCVIKTGNMDSIMVAQARLVGVWVTFGKLPNQPDKHEYPTCLTANLDLLWHLKETGHPCWNLLEADPMVCNEEQGELSFSVLARGMLGNPSRLDVEQVSKQYLLTKEQMQLANDMGEDLGCKNLTSGKGSKGNVVKETDINAAAAHFGSVLREFKSGLWRPIDPKHLEIGNKAKLKSGVNKTAFAALKAKGVGVIPDAVKWQVEMSVTDIARIRRRAAKALVPEPSWVFKEFKNGDKWDDFKPPADNKDDNAAPEAVTSSSEDDDQEIAVDVGVPVSPPAKPKRKRARKANKPPDGEAPAKKSKRKVAKKKTSAKSKRDRERSASVQKGGKLYYPKRIRNEREMTGTDDLEFLIEWKGYPKRESWTWEPSAWFIDQLPKMVREFEESKHGPQDFGADGEEDDY